TLGDSEEQLAFGPRRRALARGPERGQANRTLELVAGDLDGSAEVEAHRNVGAELPLDLRGQLGGEPREGAVIDRAEGDAVVVDRCDRVAEREDLEAAGVGEDRPVPAHEAMQAPELRDQVLAGPDVQAVGVAEQDGGTDRA